jgi:hypothetical protein
MSDRKAAQSAAMRRRWRWPGLGGPALALLLLAWTGATDPARADTIVLKSGELLEGSIVNRHGIGTPDRHSIGTP